MTASGEVFVRIDTAKARNAVAVAGIWCGHARWRSRTTAASASTSPPSCSRHGRSDEGKTSWRGRHKRWLDAQNFAYPAQRLAFQEMLNAVQETVERIDRLEAALVEIVPGWTMAPVVSAFQVMRGVQFMTAVTMVCEAGDLRRFDHPRATAARARRSSRRPGPIVIPLAWAWRISSGRQACRCQCARLPGRRRHACARGIGA